MISNQVLQSTIEGLRDITKKDFKIIECNGNVVASTKQKLIGTIVDDVESFIVSQAESQLIRGEHYFKIAENNISEYVISVLGDDEDSYRIGKIAAFQIHNLLGIYREKYDKENFIKDLLLDNLLLVDIYNKANKLGINNDSRRIVYLVEQTTFEQTGLQNLIRENFLSISKDFITSVDQKNIIFVKEISTNDSIEKIESIAYKLIEAVYKQIQTKICIAIGSPVYDLKLISNSYKEAKMALEVGKIFKIQKSVTNYKTLGIGRLIYHLPTSLCKIFIEEVLISPLLEQLDVQLLDTINLFFENNLNVSETARKLFIHRNTLVYRLDKIQRVTGIDIRCFDSAVIFKISLMISQYMNYREKYSK